MLLRSHTAEASSDGKEEMPQTYREKSTFLSSRVVRRANFMLWQKRMVLHDSQKTFSSLTMRDCEGEKQQKKNSKIPFKWEVRSRNPFAHIVVVLRPLPPLKFTHSHPSHTTSPVLSALLNYTSMSLARSYNDVKARSILPCVKIILKAQLDVISLWDENFSYVLCTLLPCDENSLIIIAHKAYTRATRERNFVQSQQTYIVAYIKYVSCRRGCQSQQLLNRHKRMNFVFSHIIWHVRRW